MVMHIPGDDGDSVRRESFLVRDEARGLTEHASGTRHGQMQ